MTTHLTDPERVAVSAIRAGFAACERDFGSRAILTLSARDLSYWARRGNRTDAPLAVFSEPASVKRIAARLRATDAVEPDTTDRHGRVIRWIAA